AELLGNALNTYAIDKGLAGRTPDDVIPYLAIGYLYFDNLDSYQNAFAPHVAQITGDIPNYTNIQPVVQISEVLQ
ncbi:MAG: EthD family reductase, partial [Flavobacteriaceae bacterium]|nr:EthD family reductase [Flavobacteriaceae bacterium]